MSCCTQIGKRPKLAGGKLYELGGLPLRSERLSARNLWDMKRWYLFYTSDDKAPNGLKALESALDLGGEKLRQVAGEIHPDDTEENCDNLSQN